MSTDATEFNAYGLDELVRRVHYMNERKGFWEWENFTLFVATKLALIHSEVSEALEEWRKEDYDEEQFVEELVDILIRTFDLLGAFSLSADVKLGEKLKKNEQRPYKHGKAF